MTRAAPPFMPRLESRFERCFDRPIWHRRPERRSLRPTLGVLLLSAGLQACSGWAASGGANATDGGEGAAVSSLAVCCSDSAMGVALRIANDYRETAFTSDRIPREAFWDQVLPMARYAGMDVATVGTLADGAVVRTLVWGSGRDTVLLWSEGGDTLPGGAGTERSVGSLALADLIRWLANTRDEDRDDALRARLRAGVTVVMLPAIRTNPDDAVQQRLLAAVLQHWHPSVVLALRDDRAARAEPSDAAISTASTSTQVASTPVASTPVASTPVASTPVASTPAMTLRIPRSTNPEVTARATRVAVTLLMALRSELPTRLYRAEAPSGSSLSPRRLADTPRTTPLAIVELESGALPADPAQRRLRAVQAAALLTTLDGIATGAVARADTALYSRLPLRSPQADSSPQAGSSPE